MVTPCEPLEGSAPLQAPEAVQELALALDQLNVLAWPTGTVAGLAERLSVGGGRPVTETLCVVVPPVPVQLSE